MRLVWRRLAPGELDHEFLWLTLSIGGVAVTAIWLGLRLPWPQCFFLRLTNHPCLTCGATRSAIQFCQFHLSEALHWNPLAFAFYCGLTLFNVYAFVVLLTRAPRLRIAEVTIREKRAIRVLVIALLAANWLYLLVTWR